MSHASGEITGMKDCVVVVIGSGLAGLTAAIEAHNRGAVIYLVEKEEKLGGNSAKATSGINGTGTRAQKAAGIDDSCDLFVEDTMNAGDRINDQNLVELLCRESARAHQFLEQYGVTLSVVSQCGGHSKPRTHRAPDQDGRPVPVGFHIVSKLRAELEHRERVTILTKSKVLSIARDTTSEGALPGPVTHVVYEDSEGQQHELRADAVVLTSGGFGAAGESEGSLLVQHAPEAAKLATTNGPWAVGDGLRLAQDCGLATRDLDQVQVHPTGFVSIDEPDASAKILAPEALRGHGGILVNAQGNRFVDELNRRDVVSKAIFDNCADDNSVRPWDTATGGESLKCAGLILSAEAASEFGLGAIGFYKFKKILKEFQTIEEAATYLNIPPATLSDTVQQYAAGGSDTFGKKVFPSAASFASGPYTVGVITPCVHYTMGGIKINTATQVLLDSAPSQPRGPVPGLFAAGEVTGGVHGGNRLAGNSLLECVVYGRIAGERASTAADIHTSCLSADIWAPLKFVEVQHLSDHMKLVRFSLHSSGQRTGLGIGQYISVRAMVDGKETIRYYSPISRPDAYGHIDLLIKVDNKGGDMSHHLTALKPGDTVDFKGPLGGIDLSKDKYSKIGMIAGGSGISPMIQIIRSVFDREDKDTSLSLLYGAVKEEDFVYADLLQQRAKEKDQFNIAFYLNEPPEGWTGGVGFINTEAIKKHLPAPGPGVKVIVCGPPVMCKVMKGLLKDAEYTDEMVFSYM